MKDAESLIERILYLDGVPNLQRLGTVRVGEDVPRSCSSRSTSRRKPIARLTRGIELPTTEGDHGSRDLLEHILEGEEEHADWLETQLGLVDSLGVALYLGPAGRGLLIPPQPRRGWHLDRRRRSWTAILSGRRRRGPA